MKTPKLVNVSTQEKEKWLYPIGDIHFGSPHCNEKLLLRTLDEAKERNAWILLMGDLGEFSNKKSPGASLFEQDGHATKQYNKILKVFSPYVEQIIGLISGNHEERIRKATGLDIANTIADNLGVTYLGFGAVLRLVVSRRGYTVFARHGSSGAATRAGKINATFQMARVVPDADLYLMGHVHDCNYIKTRVRKLNTKRKVLEEHDQYFATTGYFMDYDDSYAEEKGYEIGRNGSPKILLKSRPKGIEITV